MGNTEHTLPVGAVCDSCNHYFARKVERPLLETPIFQHLRAGMSIPNKRGRIPSWAAEEGLNQPSYRLMGRFLAKVAIEALAFKTLKVIDWNQEIVNQKELNDICHFARFNDGEDWPFTFRTLYPVNSVFYDGVDHYELLHEFDILITDGLEYYLVLALFGVEMAINLGCRSLDGYRVWLEKHNYQSPLYVPKAAQLI